MMRMRHIWLVMALLGTLVMPSVKAGEGQYQILSIPYVITNAGCYYFAGNMNSTSIVNGITVEANDVTLDLNGFSLSSAGGFIGVQQNAGCHRLTVRNGFICRWNQALYLPGDQNRLEQLGIGETSNSVWLGRGAIMRDCILANQEDFRGIQIGAGGEISGCVIYNNTTQSSIDLINASSGDGSVVRRCALYGNHADYSLCGVRGAEQIVDVSLVNNHSTISDGYGIQNAESARFSTVAGHSAALQMTAFTNLLLASGCVAYSNRSVSGSINQGSIGFGGVREVTDCTASYMMSTGDLYATAGFMSCVKGRYAVATRNRGVGFLSGSWSRSVANHNWADGFYFSDWTEARDCLAFHNYGWGFNAYANGTSLMDNHAVTNESGDFMIGSALRNHAVRNSARSRFWVEPGNFCGDLLDLSGTNYSTNAWANFKL